MRTEKHSSEAVYDKTGREIRLGDVVKVFHFIGRRNKRHYMYKQVVGERVCKSLPHYWFLSHLELFRGDGYYLARDGSILDGYEIVQSADADFESRPRIRQALTQGDAG